jgi:predicted O-linked N-acetylglucosamine transferase (SPINDLY family)
MIFEEQRRWEQRFGESLRRSICSHTNDRRPERRLRIGYVSPDFRFDSLAFFLTPLLENHDHRQLEIYCYSSVGRPDAVTQRLQKTADVWRDVRLLPDDQLAEQVRNDRIDILVDLSMHTTGNRLLAFARKPAPVQVSWLAYPGTTGMGAIDFRMTDACIDPPGPAQNAPGGAAVWLSDAWCCYAPIGEFPSVAPMPAARNGFVTFGSLNQFSKLNENLLVCWARLLGRVAESHLLMSCPEGQARERVLALLAAHGLARDRVEFTARLAWPGYVRLFEKIDVALDSFPCNGMTTTCHTLWMGLPVITRTGSTAVSRASHSLLETLGLPECVARSEEEYVAIATVLANDLPRLAELRRSMRARMATSPLMDAPRFARHVENAYRTIWQRWCAGNSPRR